MDNPTSTTTDDVAIKGADNLELPNDDSNITSKERNLDPWLENVKAEAAKTDDPIGYVTAQLANSEKRRRDTIGSWEKERTNSKVAQAKIDILQKQITENDVPLVITTEEQKELDDLMYEDPKAWRKKMNSLETQSSILANEKLEKLTAEAGETVSAQTEIERREQVLENFTKENPNIVITDEVISSDLPPRITNKLAEGKVSFEDFLKEAAEYLTKGTKVKDVKIDELPNLDDVAGGVTPKLSNDEKHKDNKRDWEQELI